MLITETVGFIEQSPTQMQVINGLKLSEISALQQISQYLSQLGQYDGRWAMVGRTHLQEAFMAYVRAVARPEGD